MSGDVIDIGFIYTRIMDIGNWIGGDQYTGRIIQIANAQIFGPLCSTTPETSHTFGTK